MAVVRAGDAVGGSARGVKVGRGRPAAARPVVRFNVQLDRDQRLALREALRSAVAGAPGGPWSVLVSSKIVYRRPASGEWWLKLTAISALGEKLFVLLDPGHQAPWQAAAAVRAAVEGRCRP